MAKKCPVHFFLMTMNPLLKNANPENICKECKFYEEFSDGNECLVLISMRSVLEIASVFQEQMKMTQGMMQAMVQQQDEDNDEIEDESKQEVVPDSIIPPIIPEEKKQ